MLNLPFLQLVKCTHPEQNHKSPCNELCHKQKVVGQRKVVVNRGKPPFRAAILIVVPQFPAGQRQCGYFGGIISEIDGDHRVGDAHRECDAYRNDRGFDVCIFSEKN